MTPEPSDPVRSARLVRLVLGADGSATVDGRPVQLPPGCEPRAALLLHACLVADRAGEPVRVRAEDPDGRWDLVAHPGGRVVEAADTDEPTAPGTPRSRALASGRPAAALPVAGTADLGRTPADEIAVRRSPPAAVAAGAPRARRLPARPVVLGTVFVLLLGLAIGGVVTVVRHGGPARAVAGVAALAEAAASGERGGQAPDLPEAGLPPTPSPAEPAAVPPGWSSRARWGLPVAGWSDRAVGEDGTMITRTPTGQVVRVAPGTGEVTWFSRRRYGATFAGPHLARLDGRDAVVLTTPTHLLYWMLPSGPQAAPAADPVAVPLPAGAAVSWNGTAPLVVSADGRGAAVVHGAGLVWLALTAGSRPLAADGLDVITVEATGWTRRSTTSSTVSSHPFPARRGRPGGPVRVENVQGSYLLAVWPAGADGQPVDLVDATSGEALTQVTLPAGVDVTRGRLVRQLSGAQISVGPLVVDTYSRNLHLLDRTYQVDALVRGLVYATGRGTRAAIRLGSAGDVVAAMVPQAAPLPLAVVGSGDGLTALIVVTNPDGALLVALSPSSTTTRRPAPPSGSPT